MIPLYLIIILGFSIFTTLCSNCCLYYYGCCSDEFVYQDYESDIETPFYFVSD